MLLINLCRHLRFTLLLEAVLMFVLLDGNGVPPHQVVSGRWQEPHRHPIALINVGESPSDDLKELSLLLDAER